jgi:hypothetical protein
LKLRLRRQAPNAPVEPEFLPPHAGNFLAALASKQKKMENLSKGPAKQTRPRPECLYLLMVQSALAA